MIRARINLSSLRTGAFFTALVLATVSSVQLLAQEKQGARQTAVSENTSTENIEELALEFVRLHHPELGELLSVLKDMDADQYQTAIRDITRARKRIESVAKRSLELHEIELQGWVIQSKIDLFLAKAVASDGKWNRSDLKALVEQRVINQKKRLKVERENLNARMQQIDESLSKLEGKETDRVEQQLGGMIRKLESKRSSAKRKP
ncbi:hypothetical protein VN12_09885 [Pirellula sp. SH-Sr6A]|uniref:hypothetical protein n=1 Tax=Pirellula sp. SH-Sr6A TaxID=1632865 RepID=UPI00078E78E1|nr:hypothetical protein [Pirellula sp. SH-Sr6A]AMV32424.1 hypothetical protein VN12_09885 [Pirellula sp. SH-Sr6A]